MSMRELSERLKNWRCERPDEWTMGEFINLASSLEHRHEQATEELAALRARVTELESRLAEIEAQEPVLSKVAHAYDSNGFVFRVENYDLYESLPMGAKFYARTVPTHLYCPNCYCTCCMNETRSNAE